MDKSTYIAIWQDTSRAAAYLTKKGRAIACDSVPSGYGKAELLTYSAADVPEREQRHITKTYPQALIIYVDAYDVAAERLSRSICAARYLAGLPQDVAAARDIAQAVLCAR